MAKLVLSHLIIGVCLITLRFNQIHANEHFTKITHLKNYYSLNEERLNAIIDELNFNAEETLHSENFKKIYNDLNGFQKDYNSSFPKNELETYHFKKNYIYSRGESKSTCTKEEADRAIDDFTDHYWLGLSEIAVGGCTLAGGCPLGALGVVQGIVECRDAFRRLDEFCESHKKDEDE